MIKKLTLQILLNVSHYELVHLLKLPKGARVASLGFLFYTSLSTRISEKINVVPTFWVMHIFGVWQPDYKYICSKYYKTFQYTFIFAEITQTYSCSL